ncbi:MAG: hypothetical protein IJ435_09230 [Clostridia bacterium]|nr:hypothetical protein [Clostridia bacterium]
MICEHKAFEIIKEYDPKPKNPDGSTRWFLFRWDDGKDGYRQLVKCKSCNAYFLVQCYRLSKFADGEGRMHRDWYAIRDEKDADVLNAKYTGMELERNFESARKEVL